MFRGKVKVRELKKMSLAQYKPITSMESLYNDIKTSLHACVCISKAIKPENMGLCVQKRSFLV